MTQPPFDAERLDRLMDEAGLDAILACSPHNVQYLLGGFRSFMFARGAVIGVSRWLPILGYVRGRPEHAFLVGNPLETHQHAVAPPWVGEIRSESWTSRDAGALAGALAADRGLARARIAIEGSFLPHDAWMALASALPGAELAEAHGALEELRAVKRPDELDLIRRAADAIVDSMLAVYGVAGPGTSQARLVEMLSVEETRRGIDFEYCLVSSGASHNRAPSPEPWRENEVCCLDSGGALHGYIGDMARMAWMGGEVPERARELLAIVAGVQDAARGAVAAGAPGREILDRAREAVARTPESPRIAFVAHGMGLVSHEAPRLTSDGPVAYRGDHAERPLEAGMVLSIETDLRDPEYGFIKLEDAVIVTTDGCEPIGDHGRDWNLAGRASI